MRKYFLGLVVLLFVYSISFAQTETDLYKKLKSIKEIAEIIPANVDTSFAEGYELMITQPVDHNKPNGAKFKQKVYLSVRKNKDSYASKILSPSSADYLSSKINTDPVVFVLEGYAAGGNRPYELTRILHANQILVEHRYFGKSIPAKKDWQYLNIKQAAGDHHAITQIFKKIFTGKWISTGISKGGETTLFYKRFYPNDVDVAVPYVAPVNLAAEDPRIYMFLNTVGTEECRNKIIQYQRAFLKHREEIKALLIKDAAKTKIQYAWDYDFLIEYMTLEYSFAFWQWGTAKCDDIPSADASTETLLNHMIKANSPYFFTQKAMEDFGAFYVQAYNEIGYYGYDITPFKDLLIKFTTSSNDILVPKDAKVKFDPRVMSDVNNWLINHGNNILYIYGGNDTWSSTSIQLTGLTNAVKMVKKGGSHGTRISSFEGEEKEKIYSILENWLGFKINKK